MGNKRMMQEVGPGQALLGVFGQQAFQETLGGKYSIILISIVFKGSLTSLGVQYFTVMLSLNNISCSYMEHYNFEYYFQQPVKLDSLKNDKIKWKAKINIYSLCVFLYILL